MRCPPRVARLALVALLMICQTARAQNKVLDLRGASRGGVTTFDALWAAYMKADRTRDLDAARRVFQEIRRLRIERNTINLEEIGLALVSEGKAQLDKGDRERAEELFGSAISLAPNLPDGYLGLALAEFNRGPLGYLPAAKNTLAATLARFPTARGQYYLLTLLIPVALLAAFATGGVVSIVLLLRHGALLLHDIEESLGSGRGHSAAIALFALLLLLPVETFQGWGWLFPWWLALLFVYLSWTERVVALAFVLAGLVVGPVMALLGDTVAAAQNPVFWAAVQAVEGGPDDHAMAQLDRAAKAASDDRDLPVLLAALIKKAGRYDDAASIYREILRDSPDDPVGRNNLANLEFARGEFQTALARYRQGAEVATDPQVKATFYYNESLAHLQKFEMQPADEAMSQATRIAAGLISTYDRLWKYDKGDYAVVDLGLSSDQVFEKFVGAAEGTGRKNLLQGSTAGGRGVAFSEMLTRFAGFIAVAVLVVAGMSFWRGRRTFTMSCLKCGTAFCRRCHLGAAVAGLCTQCYHLFVVRDGVSGPARNSKLLEVQKEDDRRARAFRVLSILTPGAGHIYLGAVLSGLAFASSWFLIWATLALAGRVFPVTEAPAGLLTPWVFALSALVLLLLMVAANRLKPEADVLVPVRRTGASPRRGRA